MRHKLYQKIGIGGIFLASIIAGSSTLASANKERIANYFHPETREIQNNIRKEQTNLDMIDLSINQIKDATALCSCLREYAPGRAVVLERELNAFNADNYSARNRVLGRMGAYEGNIATITNQTRQYINSLGELGWTLSLGTFFASIGILSIGDFRHSKRRKYRSVESHAPV